MSNRLVKSDATGDMTISTVLGPKIWRLQHLDPRFSLFYRRFVLFERLRMESGESECIIRFFVCVFENAAGVSSVLVIYAGVGAEHV